MCDNRHVTYGDGKREKMLGEGSINISILLPLLANLFVNELKANFISISQIYDNDHVI